MAKPVFKIDGTDFTEYVAEQGLKPTRNDLDADGSGRNILNGTMYRSRIADKEKWTVEFIRLPASVLSKIEKAIYDSGNYINVTLHNPKSNSNETKEYYTSTINEGIQLYRDGEIVYDGVTFDITER